MVRFRKKSCKRVCKADRLYGLYFIELERSRKFGYESCYNVNSVNFMKKRRSSVRLNPKLKKLMGEVQIKNVRTFKVRNPFERELIRVEKECVSPVTTRENSKEE